MEKIALLPGGFKPPHAGHYNMAKWLASNTDTNTVIIKVGANERDGITREMSLKLWDLYRTTDSDPQSNKLTILPSTSNSPVADVYDFIEQEAPEESTIYLGVGEKDFNDKRFANISKFAEPKGIKFFITEVPPQSGGVSGTDMRDFIKGGRKEEFNKFIPDHLTPEQKEQAWGIVTGLDEDFSKEWWSGKLSEIMSDNQATINGQLVPLEIMNSPEEQMRGMMGRKELDGGMLFPYRIAGERSFHMKDCLIPLDIVFITQGEITNIDPNCPPCSEEQCPQYTGLADNVLELPGNYCQENNINVGDYIKFPQDEPYSDTTPYRDHAKSSEWKAGMPDGHKDDIPRKGDQIHNRQTAPVSWEESLKESRGGESELHIYDFDETIARVETPIPYTVESPEGKTIEKGETTSVEFEKTKDNLKDSHGEEIKINWDFKAFANLINKGTLNNEVFQKLLDSIKNPNAKVTILTARAIGLPVTKFLKDQGIWAYVVPLGLNKEKGQPVTGEDKANWVEKRIKPTTKSVLFIDDAPENRKAMYTLKDKYPDINFNVETPPTMELNELSDREIKFFATHADILKQLNTPNFKLKFLELHEELEGERLEALEYFWEEYFSNLDDSCEIEGAFDKKVNETQYGAHDLLSQYKDQIQTNFGHQQYRDLQLMISQQKDEEVNNWINNAKELGKLEDPDNLHPTDKTMKPSFMGKAISETRLFSKGWWSNIIQKEILTEGGAAGHMNHPFDDRDLTFAEMKELVHLSLQGKLNVEADVQEKTDGQNLAVTYKKGKIGAARNKATIREPMSIEAVAAKFEGRGDIKDAFVNSMRDLENALKELPEETLSNIFKEGTNFLNMEIIYPATKNVITYGPKAYLQFHGIDEFSLDTATKIQSYGVPEELKKLTQNINARTQDTFELIPPKILTTKEVRNFNEKEPYYIEQINSLQKEFNLQDSDKVVMYHQKWWENKITEEFPQATDEEKESLVRRWAYFEKKFRLRGIQDEETRQKAIDFDKTNFQQQNKENVYQFEKIFLELGVDVLINIENYLAVNPKESINDLRKDIQKVIKQIEKSTDLEVLKKLNYQLKRIEDIGGFDKLVPSEGIVFIYKGKTYKLTGLFAPVNQLLGLTKYV